MDKKALKQIAKDVVKIIQESKATFFVTNGEDVKIPPEEVLYELRAEICTNVENYFYRINN